MKRGQMPPKSYAGGYVYVLQFSNTTVKVGSTQHPARRFYSHSADAEIFGRTVQGWWISEEFRDFSAVEDALIDFAHGLASRSIRREYFQGVSLAALRDHAVELVRASIDSEGPQVFGVACTAEVATAMKGRTTPLTLAEVSALLNVELADLEAGCESGEVAHARITLRRQPLRLMNERCVAELAARLSPGGDLCPEASTAPLLRRRVNPDDSWLVSA
jgi:hypothetical protein